MAAHWTNKRPKARVDSHVLLQRVGLGKLATTEVAAVLARPTVNQLVPTKVTEGRKVFPALGAQVRALQQMYVLEMHAESLRTLELASALFADVHPGRSFG